MTTNKNTSDAITLNLRTYYLSKDIKEARKLLNSDNSCYINIKLHQDIFEFVCLLKDPELKELKFFVNWLRNNNQFQHITQDNITNAVLSGIMYNNIELVYFLTGSNGFPKLDFSYYNYALIRQCFPKKESEKKEHILKHFIKNCDLTINKKIEKILVSLNKKHVISWFKNIEDFNRINNELKSLDNNKKIKKNKI